MVDDLLEPVILRGRFLFSFCHLGDLLSPAIAAVDRS
jgi:hypothetical protein